VKTKLWIALAFFTTFVLGFATGYWVPKPDPLAMEHLSEDDLALKELSELPPAPPIDTGMTPPPKRAPQASTPGKPSATRQEILDRENAQRERLAELLQLRQEQKPAFDSSTRVFHYQMNRTLQETRMQTRRKIMAQNDSLDQRMREILDPEQYEKWKKFHLRRQRFLQQRPHFMEQPGQHQPRM